MSESEKLAHLRGMSDPLAFSFNILDDATGTMLVHAIVFTSYKAGPHTTVKLAEPKDDPRMPWFIKFCMDNYAKGELKKQIEDCSNVLHTLRKEIDKERLELFELREFIATKMKEQKHVEP